MDVRKGCQKQAKQIYPIRANVIPYLTSTCLQNTSMTLSIQKASIILGCDPSKNRGLSITLHTPSCYVTTAGEALRKIFSNSAQKKGLTIINLGERTMGE